ncbi:vancomycin high temperature exclusion protein [Cryptosporangium sp. NPDC048952]|uniref:SanA/YdcF family protein n=1 Tax=Cryptosporangium sp. NPDC048952 TaxID=3363961 RepID=UPI00370FFD95
MSDATDVSPSLRRRLVALVVGVVTIALLACAAGLAWEWSASSGHRLAAEEAPDAPVAIVFGTELDPNGTPKPMLANRLETAAELYRAGKVRALLVSGDGEGNSGDEVTSMTRYLTRHGVPAAKIVADPHGLDSYDTCVRARDVYGVERALLVTQGFHLPRAVALCRHVGVDADGIRAACDRCSLQRLWRNRVREVPAAVKAAADALRNREPVVISPRESALDEALSS